MPAQGSRIPMQRPCFSKSHVIKFQCIENLSVASSEMLSLSSQDRTRNTVANVTFVDYDLDQWEVMGAIDWVPADDWYKVVDYVSYFGSNIIGLCRIS